ncbi:MAG: hypothetical protein KDJ41_14860 [Hyphomicrobiaceae bacterium]|nr:hypothetical protein [Hyphomicrobiaceae bacterium]
MTRTARSRATAIVAVALTGATLAALAAAGPAHALEPGKDELKVLKACERRLCEIVLKRQAKGPDLSCDLAKTWANSTVKEGGKKKRISWNFGDVRCSTMVRVTRATILAALQSPKYKFEFGERSVNCVVHRAGEKKPLVVRAAPKIEFKNGKAVKSWVRVKSIDGPSDVKSMIWTVAKLEDTLGIFHKDIIRGINKFVHEKCAKLYGDAKLQAGAGR